MAVARVTEMNVEELKMLMREILREELAALLPETVYEEDVSIDDFPVDDLIPLNPDMTFRREEMYGDDGR